MCGVAGLRPNGRAVSGAALSSPLRCQQCRGERLARQFGQTSRPAEALVAKVPISWGPRAPSPSKAA